MPPPDVSADGDAAPGEGEPAGPANQGDDLVVTPAALPLALFLDNLDMEEAGTHAQHALIRKSTRKPLGSITFMGGCPRNLFVRCGVHKKCILWVISPLAFTR